MEKLPLTLYPGRLKNTLILLISLGFVVLSIYNYGNSADWLKRMIFIFTAIMFGFGAIVAIINFIPSASHLTIDESGIKTQTLFKRNFTAWNEIESFDSRRIGLQKMVMLNYSNLYKQSNSGRKFKHTFFGFYVALPDSYGMKAEELAALLNKFLRKYQ